MSALEWTVLVIGAGVIALIWQLSRIAGHLFQISGTLHSLDAEVFRLAQEQNPSYGLCSKCSRRAIVRYVVPKAEAIGSSDVELFYCQACWWMSDSVQVSDENKYYKDRLLEHDRIAANIGPGYPG